EYPQRERQGAGADSRYGDYPGPRLGTMREQEHGPQLLGYRDIGEAQPAQQPEVGMGENPVGEQGEPAAPAVEHVNDAEADGEDQIRDRHAKTDHRHASRPG